VGRRFVNNTPLSQSALSVKGDVFVQSKHEVTLSACGAYPAPLNLRTATQVRVGMKLIQALCVCLLSTLAACSLVPQHRSAASVTDGAKLPVPGVRATGVRTPDSPPAAQAKAFLRTKQFDAALHELQLAAEHGDVQSEYLLGLVYANGLGTPVSDADARRWLAAADEKSYPDAARALAGLAIPPTRSALGDAELARELLIWAIRHDDEPSIDTFIKTAGVESTDVFGRAPLAYAVTTGSEVAVKRLLAAGASPDHADHFGVTQLMLAAEAESQSILEWLLADAKNLNARDSVGNTALFYAARVGRTNHVERLLAAGASFNGANADGWTVLDVSSKTGHAQIARLLRDAGATGSLKTEIAQEGTGVDPTRPGLLYDNWPAVAIAASRDDDNAVEALLAAGARADEPTPYGDTPLIIAAKYHAAKVIAPLLKAGAAPGLADNDGTTALGYASAHGVMDVLDAMLEKGVSPDTRGPAEDPPLVRATRAADTIAVKQLIDAGADINAAYPGRMTALMVAAAAPDPEMVEILMAAKPNLAIRDRIGRNALWFAAGAGNEQIVDRLLAAGSPVDGSAALPSPLFAAVQAGRASTLRHLLRKGLAPDAKNSAGDTPLIAAAARGDPAIVRTLLDGGASINAQNSAGNTALIVATREGHTDVCRVLLEAGADAGLHNQDQIDALDTATRRHLTDIVALFENR
jgi:ankyrin repeat protein